ncbi:MAG: hypothetical protein AB7V42_10320 [Thermoleophilia bacterium]
MSTTDATTTPEGVGTRRTASSGIAAAAAALLAVPGTTWAWELPLGGLWIGAPLCLAAIVLGLRARRDGDTAGARIGTAAIALASALIVMMIVWSIVEAATA